MHGAHRHSEGRQADEEKPAAGGKAMYEDNNDSHLQVNASSIRLAACP